MLPDKGVEVENVREGVLAQTVQEVCAGLFHQCGCRLSIVLKESCVVLQSSTIFNKTIHLDQPKRHRPFEGVSETGYMLE